jgi:CSLREA domain-containing protein
MSTRFASWFKGIQCWIAKPELGAKRIAARKMSKRATLSVEQLENRLVPATFMVNSMADLSILEGVNPATGAIIGHGNTVTLRSAIDAANMTPGGNTIKLMVPGTYSIALPGANTGTDATGAFAILPTGGNLSILNASGGAVTVNGNHLDRVFDINPTFNPASPTAPFAVTLQGFTITNGAANPGDGAAGSGGGVRDIGNASLTLTNMVVTNNTASADGGGVSMENVVSEPWKLAVNNSVISNNHAGDAGGGLETDGTGKVFINAGTVITGNTCVNQGAGIWLDAINAGSAVSSVTVTPNNGNEGTVFQPTVTFTSVDGLGSGAQGTVVLNSNTTIVGVTITNPGSGYDMAPAVTFFLDGSPLIYTAVANLTPLPLQSATLTVTGTVLSNNQALNGPGGAIGNAGKSAVTITNSTVSNNASGMAGGGFADQNNLGTLVVANSLFLNNVAVADGGAIQEGGPTTSITNSQISGNSSGATGGGVFATGTTLFVQDSTIANNTASGNANTTQGGGGIELQTTGTGFNASTIVNTTIANNKALNSAGVFGGAIDAMMFNADLVLQNDTINGNFGDVGGGIVWEEKTGSVSLQNTILAGNTARLGQDALNAFLPFTDLGGNLIGVGGDFNSFVTAGTTQTGTLAAPLNPLLAPLGNYGGPMIGAAGATQVLQTEALQTGSSAIGAGTLFRAPAYDERGIMDLLNGAVNVGAVSAVVAPPQSMTQVKTSMPLVSQKMVNGVLTTTYLVNSTADTHTPAAGTLTLRAAIDMANQATGNKVIELLVPGDYKVTLPGANTGTNASGAFAILPSGGNVAIVNASGGTAIVDGNHLDRVFDINPADDTNFNDEFTVTLQGITITNGIAQFGDGAAGSGGGIRDQGIASLTLNNVTLTNNLATADGGGLSMENTVSSHWVLTINNSVISYNHAGDAGGGVETDGSSKVAINAGTVIVGNTCVNQGAGVWLDAITSTASSAEGTVASVTITNPGGHGYIGPTFTVTFTSVDGKGNGAQGIPVLNAGGMITGVTITNPGAGYDMPPTVSFNYALGTPDITAVAVLTPLQVGATLTVTGATISNNDSLNMLGGGIGNAGNGAVTIANSTIKNNFSAGTGGGFADANNQGTLIVTNSLFLNNVAVGSGGGIQEGGASTTITSSEFAGNISGNTGGGLFASGTTLQITNSTFANNLASGDGNGLGGGGIELQTTGASTITGTTIAFNRALNNAGTSGGGIDAGTGFTGQVALLNDTTNANYATNGGGVFWADTAGSTFSVQNTIIAQNFIEAGGNGVDANSSGGTFKDLGGNFIGIAGDANSGFTAGTTQVGSLANPLNPLLGPLTNNGGPVVGAMGTSFVLQTEALQMGSKGLNKGVKTGAPGADERGFKNGMIITIGAVNG